MSRFRLHYKNNPYRLLGVAHHSETQEKLALYECLYPTDLGPLWVRPYDMFFGQIGGAGEGGSQPRFREVPVRIESFTSLGEPAWFLLEPLLREIFGEAERARVEDRMMAYPDPLIQFAFLEKDFVGFKIGHGSEDGIYESWLGGVREDRRGLGVGRALMAAQHAFARERRYRRVRAKTLSRWREMLVFNLRAGFEVVGTEKDRHVLKIILEKFL
ncbi:MAG: DUF1653 domain-containing protein [Bdellovibrionaceae bacterium]|nr:DUF1653 domain-containing protein [Pseudobdellovibrionaceae bacterium]MBX3034448.1 DUF1653 domain-containing protein [Pseudobdellovibrionaceae bacterium]